MLGAIIGDIVGSRFEWHNIKSKDFLLFTSGCFPTDDSIMTLAIAKALLSCRDDYSDLANQAIVCMQDLGRYYPHAGYGGRFSWWLRQEHPKPYGSYGNGAAMRVSPCAYAAETLDEVKALAKTVTEVTHNHPEGIKGAEATVTAVFMELHGHSVDEIRKEIQSNYYALDFTLDQIRSTYEFNETCQGSVPQAIQAFLESTNFEDAIRNAISLGGDSDTIAAITGSIAEAYYKIPMTIRTQVMEYLNPSQMDILERFDAKYGLTHE